MWLTLRTRRHWTTLIESRRSVWDHSVVWCWCSINKPRNITPWKYLIESGCVYFHLYIHLFRARNTILLYASETWTLTVADSKSLDAFHMKCQRRILGIILASIRAERRGCRCHWSLLPVGHHLSPTFSHLWTHSKARRGSACPQDAPQLHQPISWTCTGFPGGVDRPGRPRGRWIDQLRRDNSQPPADLWRQAINRGHSGRATQRSSDYATIILTWPNTIRVWPTVLGYWGLTERKL